MIKRIIVLILIIFAFKGCTKDDICPEGTATTPNLIITFNDIVNPANRKQVEGLSIVTNYADTLEVLARTTTDSIAIPLNINSDTTKYKFIRTTITTTDTIRNVDSIVFVYQRNNSYVTRACGFKTEFDNLDTTLEEEGTENWIQDIITIRDTINDENEAHLTILH
ncbi:DUF6452 family protein [Aequorivita sp. CIP111184]|uniref:DUF6452 family protein n=1 Tax=Aequorivita sp. CIP111184 TaxID=2211356 RepID=UPI000DBC3C8C|nr:DUF6452 family protein [Aequorivita sp. CIP111184]SRX55793.1 hypothetical protein AEQU1_02818 [Aequorivita sp. CIP111184]